MEGRQKWISEDDRRGFVEPDEKLFVNSGMLRVQPSDQMGALEKETLANMERDGLRNTQFVKSNPEDRSRAHERGWEDKLLDFNIPNHSAGETYEAVLDSLAGFVRCSAACAHYQKVAAAKGVEFCFGSQGGTFDSFLEAESALEPGKKKVMGLRTKDGTIHDADVVVVAGESNQETQPDINLADCHSWIIFNTDSPRSGLPPGVISWKLGHIQDRQGEH